MRSLFRQGNPLKLLFVAPRREEYLARYVVREYKGGRSLEDVLDDPYLRNRSTVVERARLLERSEVVAALGAHAISDIRLTLAERAVEPARAPSRRAAADAAE